ncbi:MAG: ABC transporter permease [Acidobacteriota bacterium]|nr:ABC transporter permease [Acidobacteriota bacterium]
MSGLFQSGIAFCSHVASISRLTAHTVYWSTVAPFYRKSFSWRSVAEQMDRAGVQSFFIVSLVLFLIGMILVLQTAYLADNYGQLDIVPGAVAVSLTRAIGPLLTAVVVTGRVGAAYAAELGAQKVNNEITALECMAINPIGFLIAPRFLALFIMLPVLSIYGCVLGLAGGYVMGVYNYGIAPSVYWESTFDLMEMKDLVSGLVKSFVFAVVICMVGCYKGFTVKGGSTGVGQATMEAVVTSIVLIIAGDVVFTALMIHYWP